VAIGYRSSETDAKEAAAALEAAGMPGLAVYLDTTDDASVQEAFRRVTDEVGSVTGLVNNAGFSQDGLLVKYSMDTYDRVMATNVRGSFLCTQAALRSMLRAKFGRIVNMSSAVALHGNAGQTDYAAANDVLDRLALHLAERGSMRAISVAWGPWDSAGMVSPELRREYARRGIGLIPLEAGVASLMDEIDESRATAPRVVLMGAADARHAVPSSS